MVVLLMWSIFFKAAGFIYIHMFYSTITCFPYIKGLSISIYYHAKINKLPGH